MKRFAIAAALLVCACAPPVAQEEAAPELVTATADAAGNRLQQLALNGGRMCTADGAWCVEMGNPGAQVFHAGAAAPVGQLPVGDNDQSSVWPMVVRFNSDASVLFGVARRETEMYSGGGAAAVDLELYRITPGVEGSTLVATAPLSRDVTVRACFDEEDVRNRREACSDQYTFGGALSLDAANASGPPRLVLTTTATTYPGPRSRTSDSTEAPALQQSDLAAAPDAACSYRRVLTLNGAAYAYDTPPPACEDYQLQ